MDEAREALYAGLDVGGTFLKGALLDGEGRLLRKLKQPTRKDSPSSLLDQFAAMVAEHRITLPPFMSVVPGPRAVESLSRSQR